MVFLAMCFVKYTPFIVPFISMTADALVVYHLQDPGLWNIFKFLLGAQFFLCVLGELLRRVLSVQAQDIDQHHREAALMHAVRLNQREIEAYLRMSSNAPDRRRHRPLVFDAQTELATQHHQCRAPTFAQPPVGQLQPRQPPTSAHQVEGGGVQPHLAGKETERNRPAAQQDGEEH